MSAFLLAVLTHTPFRARGRLAALIAPGLMQASDHHVIRPGIQVQSSAPGAWSLASASAAFGLLAARAARVPGCGRRAASSQAA